MPFREWETDFLAQLAKLPNVAEACRAAGVTRQAAYQARQADPEFASRWKDALDESTDDLVGKLYERALKDDTTAAIFLLKSHRRDVYGDRVQTDLTTGGERIQTVIYLPENGRGADDAPDRDPPPAGTAD